MNRKIIVIVALAAVLAAGVGVYSASHSGTSLDGEKEYDLTAAADNAADDAVEEDAIATVIEGETYDSDVEESIVNEALSTIDVEDTAPDYADEIVSTTFRVKRTVDHTTGEEVSPRVVLGTGYAQCYIKFDTDGNFELFIDASSGKIKQGTYELFDSIISVTYGDGIGTEYDIISDDFETIAYIIVNYGDYDVYFG